jgi:hypothetical protein
VEAHDGDAIAQAEAVCFSCSALVSSSGAHCLLSTLRPERISYGFGAVWALVWAATSDGLRILMGRQICLSTSSKKKLCLPRIPWKKLLTPTVFALTFELSSCSVLI